MLRISRVRSGVRIRAGAQSACMGDSTKTLTTVETSN
jgi:hypothetical protein